MLRRFLYWVTNYLRVRIITGDNNEPYLERYRLVGFLGWAVFIHRFIASDPDRGLHDHPWRYAFSVILAGRYREIRPDGVRVLRAPAINIIRGNDFHRIVLDDKQEAWSIFTHGRRVKGWGFQREGTFIPHANNAEDHASRHWWKTAPLGRTVRRVGRTTPDTPSV